MHPICLNNFESKNSTTSAHQPIQQVCVCVCVGWGQFHAAALQPRLHTLHTHRHLSCIVIMYTVLRYVCQYPTHSQPSAGVGCWGRNWGCNCNRDTNRATKKSQSSLMSPTTNTSAQLKPPKKGQSSLTFPTTNTSARSQPSQYVTPHDALQQTQVVVAG